MEHLLALEFASTIRHDGHGGVADDLTTPQELSVWVAERCGPTGVDGFAADRAALDEVLALRAAVRALFARAVRPGPPSPADAHRLLPDAEALSRINRAAARHPVADLLDWPAGGDPSTHPLSTDADPLVRLTATLARATVDFLTGPHREQLRACTAPRCVRYFVKGHGRQEYCKPSCSNRARVARHYERTRSAAGAVGAVGADWNDEQVATDPTRS
ncbi:CGNR zinc finger domain-containing protein [Kitasatospora sp. NBC_01539]|uniref:CGNR zinc finger domain-containing protein n=1 Tax=Kitasatospora sp. NBC_01539 TaxID=2903577 RepID=UPI0038600B40